MEAPAVQIYKLFRYDLNLSDGKSLELMNLLNKEYKSSIKEDIASLDKKVDARFEQVDARFEKVDVRFEAIEERLNSHDKRFDALDSKIDVKTAELHGAIHKSTSYITRWVLGLVLTVIGMCIAMLLKK